MAWLFLIGAIALEFVGTMSLRMVSMGRRIWSVPLGAGYLLSFVLLTLALANGMPLGVAYGIWAAAGVALIAIFSRVLFKEPLTKVMLAGIGLIVAGVLLVELGRVH